MAAPTVTSAGRQHRTVLHQPYAGAPGRAVHAMSSARAPSPGFGAAIWAGQRPRLLTLWMRESMSSPAVLTTRLSPQGPVLTSALAFSPPEKGTPRKDGVVG